MRLSRIAGVVRASLLAVPAAFVALAVALSVAARAIDVRTSVGRWLFPGDAESARTLLSVVASGAVTLMGLVFSVTMLVIQLTSSQYSPRVLRTFLRDRNAHATMGMFAGTFAFALASLRAVDGDTVPQTSVSIAVLLAFVTLGVFVQFVDHVAKKIRVSAIIGDVAADAAVSLDRFLARVDAETDVPDALPPVSAAAVSSRAGSIVQVREDELVKWASQTGTVVEVVAPVGAFVRSGARLLHVRGDITGRNVHIDELDRLVVVATERSPEQDPLYGFRQLVDIAQRALSPSLNDPTTAAQVVDAVHDLLARLAPAPLPCGLRADGDGTLRLRLVEPAWSSFLDLALDEILLQAEAQPQVLDRVVTMLDDLLEIATPDRHPSLLAKRAVAERALHDTMTAIAPPLRTSYATP